jgi:hypothetical protein
VTQLIFVRNSFFRLFGLSGVPLTIIAQFVNTEHACIKMFINAENMMNDVEISG